MTAHRREQLLRLLRLLGFVLTSDQVGEAVTNGRSATAIAAAVLVALELGYRQWKPATTDTPADEPPAEGDAAP